MTVDDRDDHPPDAREVDDLVDAVLDGRVDPGTSAGEPGLTTTLLRLRALGHEPVPPEVRASQLARLRSHPPAAARRPKGAQGGRLPWSRRRTSSRLVPLTAGLVALMTFAGGGTVAVAQEAAPDEALYGVKRASEQVWAAVPRGPQRAAEVQLALADRRADEARRSPEHAEELVAEGADHVDAAAREHPDAAVDGLARLLGDGDDRLPDTAAPAARAALHRNCTRLAERHGLDTDRCGPAPVVEHPGRGHGPPDRDRGPDLGPGGRPDGAAGPPPGVSERRGQRRGGPPDAEDPGDPRHPDTLSRRRAGTGRHPAPPALDGDDRPPGPAASS